jgi:hypothetical protein
VDIHSQSIVKAILLKKAVDFKARAQDIRQPGTIICHLRFFFVCYTATVLAFKAFTVDKYFYELCKKYYKEQY